MKAMVALVDISRHTYVGSYEGDSVISTERNNDMVFVSKEEYLRQRTYDLDDPFESGHVFVPVSRLTGELLPQYANNPCLYANEASAEGEFPNVFKCMDYAREKVSFVTRVDIKAGSELLIWYGSNYRRSYELWWLDQVTEWERLATTSSAIQKGNQLVSAYHDADDESSTAPEIWLVNGLEPMESDRTWKNSGQHVISLPILESAAPVVNRVASKQRHGKKRCRPDETVPPMYSKGVTLGKLGVILVTTDMKQLTILFGGPISAHIMSFATLEMMLDLRHCFGNRIAIPYELLYRRNYKRHAANLTKLKAAKEEIKTLKVMIANSCTCDKCVQLL